VKPFLLLAALAAGCAHSLTVPSSSGMPDTLDGLLARANGEHRVLLLEFGAPPCVICANFDQKVLPDPAVQAALGGVVFARFDAETPDGGQVFHRVRLSVSVPAFYVVDGLRHVITHEIGVMSRERFVAFVEEAADFGGNKADLDQALAMKPNDARTRLRAARWYRAHDQLGEALSFYESAARLSPEGPIAEAVAWESLVVRNRLPGARPDARALLAFLRAHPGIYSERGLAALLLSDLPRAELAEFLVEAAQPLDAHAQNGLVYLALAAHAYDAALTLAQLAVKRVPDAAHWDSLAEVHYYRGEAVAAVAFAKKALEREPANTGFQRNLRRFERADGAPSPEVEEERSHAAEAYRSIFGVPPSPTR
jgi:hypothetical protein